MENQPSAEVLKPVNNPRKYIDIKIVLLVGIFVLVLGAGLFIKEFVLKKSESTLFVPWPTITAILSVKPTPFPIKPIDGQLGNQINLLFRRKEQLFIKHGNEVRQLTDHSHVGKFKVSHDKKYVGWIDQTVEQVKLDQPQIDPNGTIEEYTLSYHPTSLYITDLQTYITRKVVDPLPPGQILNRSDEYLYYLSDFDFYPNDSSKILYTRNGLWSKDLSSGKDEQLLQNDTYQKRIKEFGHSYQGVASNPSSNFVLLDLDIWEGNLIAIYNLSSKTETILDGISRTTNLWSQDGSYVISYAGMGYSEGGLWVTPLMTLQPKLLTPQPNIYSISTLAQVNDTDYVFYHHPLHGDQSLPQVGIYRVNNQGKFRFLENKVGISDFGTIPGTQDVTYLQNCTSNSDISKVSCTLKKMNSDAKEDIILIEDVNSYQIL